MSDVPGFEEDEQLEGLLSTPVAELDEETRVNLQRYKARKLKAIRDADLSTDKPEWWQGGGAPETADYEFDSGTADGDEPSEDTGEDSEAEESAEEPEPSGDSEAEEESRPEPAEAVNGSGEAPAAESKQQRAPRARAPKREGLPKIGWSGSGVEGEAEQELLGEAEQPAETPPAEAVEREGEPAENGEPSEPAETEAEPESSGEAAREPEEGAEETPPEEEQAPAEEPEPEPAEPDDQPASGAAEDVEVPEVDFSDVPGLEHDPELDELLTENVAEMDEETRTRVQRYKARVLKAKRDADQATEVPEWWSVPRAFETVEESDQSRRSPGAAPSGGAEEAEEPESAQPAEETDEAEPVSDGKPEEGSEEEREEPESEPEAEEEAPEEVAEEDPEAAVEAESGGTKEGEEEEEEPEEPELSLEDLGDEPSEDELLRAHVIDAPVEQEDSQGIFKTSVEYRKCYLSYTRRSKFLTLHHYELPDTIEDERIRTWIKDLLARKAYEFAEENELIVIPQGSDIWDDFLARHPEFESLSREPRFV